jgi:sugar phosphate isomerase/epimerase
MTRLTRRQLLAATLAAPALWGKNHIGRSRISAITDEIANSPAEAVEFARRYGLEWVELRRVPGSEQFYAGLDEPALRAASRQFAANGLRVSFLNTALLKFGLPGSRLARERKETAEARAWREANEARLLERRMDDLRQAIAAAHILGVSKVRVFTFLRVTEPRALFPRLVETLGPMAHVAEKEGVQLLIENEGSCNVASCAEMAELLKKLPSKALGINWDPLNATTQQEKPFPDGYKLLPRKRIGNVQVKGKSVIDGPQRLDWAAILNALAKDGYRGQVGLETHFFDGTRIQASHRAIQEILRIVEPT